LAPLYSLLKKNTHWNWGAEQKASFQSVKNQLTSDALLVHYDPDCDLLLTCDASPYGVGAVLSHHLAKGVERPIAFASRTLAPAERRYSHLDKEALAIIFGLKHFHQYLAGRHFVIYSDHKPLMHLFNASKAIPTMASAWLQRWSLMLSSYDYEIQYRPGSEQANADACSRLPLPDVPTSVPQPAETILVMEHLANTPVSTKQINNWTRQDPLLSKVMHYVLHGWPKQVPTELKPFQNRSTELSVEENCVLWGNRVVIPPQGRKQLLDELHVAHPGMERMKSLARSYFWWPGLDAEIEQKVKHCDPCQTHRKRPPLAPLHPWEWPDRPWSRIHIDYAGPLEGRMLLVIVDSHSKWLDVHVTTSSTSTVTIDKLQVTFATLGIPEVIVSDNGSAFTSQEFGTFLKHDGIKHIKTAAYHPASNGLAERYVQIVKDGLKKISGGTIESRVARLLSRYRVTPQSTTKVSPAELLFGRKLRTRFDLLQPDMAGRVRYKQAKQKENHDASSRQRELHVGMTVYVYNNNGYPDWLPGIIEKQTGPVSYLVKLSDGRTWRRHVDHIRIRTVKETLTDTDSDDIVPFTTAQSPDLTEPANSPNSVSETEQTVPLRRSSRLRKPNPRFSDNV